ncbi:MAG: YkuS family protein [Bacteroidota bacterium]
MQRVVALEDGVQNLKPHLEEEGYQVIDLDQNTKSADAYIISGMDENLTGDMTRIGEGFVINARGRQPEEILYDLEKHFNLQQ